MRHSGSGGGSTATGGSPPLPSGAATAALQSTAFASGVNTRPTVTGTSSIVLASNTNRKYAFLFNQSGAVIYIKLGAIAVVGEGIRVPNNEIYEINRDNLFTGDIHAIRGAGSGAIEVFEGS